MFKINSRNTRTRCETCSKLTIKIRERRQNGSELALFGIQGDLFFKSVISFVSFHRILSNKNTLFIYFIVDCFLCYTRKYSFWDDQTNISFVVAMALIRVYSSSMKNYVWSMMYIWQVFDYNLTSSECICFMFL